MLALDLLRGLQRAGHNCAVGNDGQVRSRIDDLGLAERNHVVGSGIRRAAVSLAVKTFVFQKQDRIVATNRSAQQSRGIQGIRGEHHTQAWNMCEDALPALRVINRAAGQVSANRDANHNRAGECIVRPPPDHRQLIAEKLDLHHRLKSARSHACSAAHDGGLGQRRIENAVVAELVLQAEGQLEDSTLALHQLAFQVFFAAAIGHVFAEDHDALVALHFVAQRRVDQVGHGLRRWLFAIGRIRPDDHLRIERGGCWV